jgi:hypothetical protein
MEGAHAMPIDWDFNGTRTTRRRWRNLITGECRLEPPLPGELDWVENASAAHCSD